MKLVSKINRSTMFPLCTYLLEKNAQEIRYFDDIICEEKRFEVYGFVADGRRLEIAACLVYPFTLITLELESGELFGGANMYVYLKTGELKQCEWDMLMESNLHTKEHTKGYSVYVPEEVMI